MIYFVILIWCCDSKSCVVCESVAVQFRPAVGVIVVRYSVRLFVCGPGSSVDRGTDCGLDGPGSNPCGDEISRQSRPALGPTQSPVKWVPGLSRG